MFSNFYLFCDKDKSARLDERERTIGILTLFKYIDDENNELNADSILPIVYDRVQTYHTEDKDVFDVKEFQGLFIDTLTEKLRLRNFESSNNLGTSLFGDTNNKLDSIIDNIQKNLNNQLRRNAQKYEPPFSFSRILMHFGLLLLCFILLPIVVFYTIISTLRKNTDQSKSIIIRIILIFIIAIISALLSCIVYLIVIEIILYHIHYNEQIQWHISALEVYWPFALICCIVFIAYLFGSPFIMNSDHNKNRQLEQYYHEAELDILKYKAEVVVLKNGKFELKTMAKWESQNHNSRSKQTQSRKQISSNYKKKNIWRKLIQSFINMYQNETEYSKTYVIVLKIVALVLCICIAVLHACIPIIYRTYSTVYEYPNTTKSARVQLIEITFAIDDSIIYSIFLLMIMYAYHLYHILGIKLNLIIKQTTNNNQYSIAPEDNCYLNLKKEINLDLFLAQVRHVIDLSNSIEYQVR